MFFVDVLKCLFFFLSHHVAQQWSIGKYPRHTVMEDNDEFYKIRESFYSVCVI